MSKIKLRNESQRKKKQPKKGPPVISDDSDNYDDYLDQLCDEEEEDPSASFDLGAFFIDTNPSDKESDLVTSDPFEEDFPAVSQRKKRGSRGKKEESLRSLVSHESIDDAIATEEGKASYTSIN